MADKEGLRLRALGDAQREHVNPTQWGNLHNWDVYIEVLDKRIQDAKKGLSWKERWQKLDTQLIEGRKTTLKK